MNKYKLLQKYIDQSTNIVFFGGAGVSTESGIKDFRSKDGLYNETYKYSPETILSHSFFMNNPEEFYKFYKEKLNALDYKPNITHTYLKKLEDSGKNITIITQNIDGLHEKANSKNILLLHGTIYSNHCLKCQKEYSAEYVFKSKGIPKCSCNGIIKPDVILYEEPLDEATINKSIEAINNCDLLIIAGTSLKVYPAASFVQFFNGKHLVIINKEKTSYDSSANLVINDNLSNIFSKLKT